MARSSSDSTKRAQSRSFLRSGGVDSISGELDETLATSFLCRLGCPRLVGLASLATADGDGGCGYGGGGGVHDGT